MRPCVIITEKEFHKGKPVFDSADGLEFYPVPADEPALAEEVRKRGASAVIVGVDNYTADLYAALAETAADGKALIARFGVGCDGIDLAKAHAHGILVTNTPGVLDQSVAEHTVWLTGTLARHIAAGDATMRRGDFSAQAGMELAGKTLGIIGFGPIGQCVARIVRMGLGMHVRAVDKLPLEVLAERTASDPERLRELTGVTQTERDANTVIREADVISVHLPALPATKHFINAQRLAHFKPGALLINTSRGALVDETALFDALHEGTLSGAALDVFENEPYSPQEVEKDLRSLDNVVLTPHTGSNTTEACRRMAEACVVNVRAFVKSKLDALSLVGL